MTKLQISALWLVVASLLWGCQSVRYNQQSVILYLSWDSNGRIQLYKSNIETDSATALTHSQTDILNYAPAPDGSQIVYSTGDALWLMDRNGRSPNQLLSCAIVQCNQIVWHPDSQRLLYERTEPNAATNLWWLDSETGETIALHQNNANPSQAAQFSSDGQWVSYVLPLTQEIEFFNFENSRRFRLPSAPGTPAIWHPAESKFLYNNQQLITFHGGDDGDHQGHTHDFTYSIPLLLASTTDEGQTTALVSELEITDDASPAWSPDGEWIVFGRNLPGVENGRQLWLIRPDGSEAKALTDDPMIHHGVPSWSGDGRYILYQRFDTQTSAARPGIWLLEPDTGKLVEVAAVGFNPQWLP